jgi:hypothetical protein
MCEGSVPTDSSDIYDKTQLEELTFHDDQLESAFDENDLPTDERYSPSDSLPSDGSKSGIRNILHNALRARAPRK